MPSPSLHKALAALLLSAAAAANAGLVGHAVTGSFTIAGGATNYFDPARGFVPGDTLNTAGTTVLISASAIEFGVEDGANRDLANFTDTQLIISDFVKPGMDASPWTMRFTSADAGLFTGLSLVSSSFDPSLTYSLSGDTLTVAWGGTSMGNQQLSATFRLTADEPQRVPEPSSAALLLAALLSGALARSAAQRRDRR